MKQVQAILLISAMLGVSRLAIAAPLEQPLPPAPMEQMGNPVNCDPPVRSQESGDPNTALSGDCPTQPQPFEGQSQPLPRDKGEPQQRDTDGGSRNQNR